MGGLGEDQMVIKIMEYNRVLREALVSFGEVGMAQSCAAGLWVLTLKLSGRGGPICS